MHLMRRWHAVPLAALVALAVGAGLFGAARPQSALAGSPSVTLAVDCDPGTAGVQSTCDNVTVGAYTLDLVVTNSGTATNMASLSFELEGSSTGSLVAPEVAAGGVNDNPNLNDGALGAWNCSLPEPVADSDGNPADNHTYSTLQCFVFPGNVALGSGASIVVASVNYTAGAGGAQFAITNGVVGDEEGSYLVECPGGTGLCTDALVGFGQLAPADTPTPTNTATATPTRTNTPTATATCATNCPTSTSLAFVTVTPTPGTPTAAAGSETPAPQPTEPGGTTPPGGQQPGGGTGPGSGRPITLPDTGAGADGGIDWTMTVVMAIAAMAAGLMAGGVYFAAVRRIERDKGE